MIKKISYVALMSAAFAMVSGNANASGYQLNEYSATNLGRAFAGMGVVGDDYSAIAYNPAGMILQGTGMQVGISTIQMHSEAKGNITTLSPAGVRSKPDGKIDLYKFLPHLFMQKKISEDFAIGLGVFTPFGLASDYNKHWFGAAQGTKTALEVIDISPTIAYRLGKLSLGAGWIIRYVHGDVRNEIVTIPGSESQMDLDGWSANSWSLGALYEFNEDTRVGFSYRYNNAHTVKGQHNVRYGGTTTRYHGRSKMTLPASATLSVYHKLNEKYALTATTRWAKWDKFDDFVMSSEKVYSSSHEGWKNVVTYSVGMDYYHNDSWTFRGGLSYDRSPIGSNRNRTVRIPDSDRFWVTAGLSYKTQKFQYDLGYAHLFMRSAHSYNFDKSSGSRANVKFHNYSNMLGLQVQYKF